MYRSFIKRLMDVLIVFLGLLILLPVLLGSAFWLHFANKGTGAFFFQERPGKNGKLFKVIKLKTMTDERDEHGNLLPDEKRLTKVGKFVRSTSMDELPQLINVLKGDMSLIGPRPLLPQYLPLYSVIIKHIKSGICCTNRFVDSLSNGISWSKKFELDIWYVDHCSFLLDLKIILLTIKKVFVREGINSDDSATMEPFTGTN